MMRIPPIPADQIPGQLKRWRVRVFVTCWTMYASYYLARQNIAIAIPSLESEMGLTKIEIGWITTGLFIAYSIGQLVHGIMGDRFGARKLGTIGMVVSGIANIFFGLAYTFPMFVSLWVISGFFQATGAPLRIKTIANWFPTKSRGKVMGFLGTDYMAGNVVCWLLSGWLVSELGWRYVFIVPGIIFLGSAVHFYFRIRNQPEDVGFPPLEELERLAEGGAPAQDGQATAAQEDDEGDVPMSFILKQSLGNFRVWIVGFAYFGVDLIRYGFMVWAPTYMFEQGAPISEAAYKSVMIPLVGSAGIIASGWLSDKIGGRRAPIISVMLFILCGLAVWYRYVPAGDWIMTLILLGAIGFFLYGPHLLMGATIAMDLGSRKASAAASGVIDSMGYLGAALAGVGTAYIREAYGWDGAFILWISGGLFAALLILTLWKYKPPEDRMYM